MKLGEVTKKQFLNRLKDPNREYALSILRKMRANLRRHKFEVVEAKIKIRTGRKHDIDFKVPLDLKLPEESYDKLASKATSIVQGSLPKDYRANWYWEDESDYPLPWVVFELSPGSED